MREAVVVASSRTALAKSFRGSFNVTRPDEVRPSLPNEEALRNAPAQANGLFIVPKIVE